MRALKGMLAQPRNTKISRKTTLSACAPCKISKKRCDIARPCSRCFQSRCAELCKDTILSVSMSLQTLSRFFIIISFRFFSALNDASDCRKQIYLKNCKAVRKSPSLLTICTATTDIHLRSTFVLPMLIGFKALIQLLRTQQS